MHLLHVDYPCRKNGKYKNFPEFKKIKKCFNFAKNSRILTL